MRKREREKERKKKKDIHSSLTHSKVLDWQFTVAKSDPGCITDAMATGFFLQLNFGIYLMDAIEQPFVSQQAASSVTELFVTLLL